MILYTFFDSYDLSGKTIVPFCTSGGSSLSGTVNMGIRIDEPASWPALGNGFECGGKKEHTSASISGSGFCGGAAHRRLWNLRLY